MQRADVVLDALHSLGMKGHRLQRAYRLLYNPALYLWAEPAGDPAEREDLIETLRRHRFRWGQCPDRDRRLSQVLVLILTRFLRPRDPPPVHGLRDDTGLHSALKASRALAARAAWLCVLDLHPHLTYSAARVRSWLTPHVADRRFADLVSRYFDAYPEPTLSPGSVLSGAVKPDSLHGLLCHLALQPLDTHLVAMRQAFRPTSRSRRDSGHGNTVAGRPTQRYIGFVRYLNWILLALSGRRDDAATALREVAAILHAQGFDLAGSEPQPLPSGQSACAFLGYELRRDATGKTSLHMPEGQWKQVCRPFLHRGKPASLGVRTRWDDKRIQGIYRAEFDAVSQYYALAENRHRLRAFRWTLRSSMYRTLAQKHKCHVRDVVRSGRADGLDQAVAGTQFQVRWIDDVQWRDPQQMRAGEPCAMKVARTVRREALP